MKNSDKIIVGAALGVAAVALLLTTKKGKKLAKCVTEKAEEKLSIGMEEFQSSEIKGTFDTVADKIVNFMVDHRDSIADTVIPFLTKSLKK